jgi:hypothetical protein
MAIRHRTGGGHGRQRAAVHVRGHRIQERPQSSDPVATLASHNIPDFEETGVDLVNPWELR